MSETWLKFVNLKIYHSNNHEKLIQLPKNTPKLAMEGALSPDIFLKRTLMARANHFPSILLCFGNKLTCYAE